MAAIYLLDSGPLGLLAHDRPVHRVPIQTWIVQEMKAGATVYLSEVADFEVRRELTRLIRAGQLPPSRLNRLDQLANICTYLPVTTSMWKRAAEFWADARLQGLPTASAAALDADVLVAAQAADVLATVVTNNAAHIGRWGAGPDLAVNLSKETPMTITVNLSAATLKKVQAEAAASGKDIDTVVQEALEVGLTKRKRSLADVLKPINEAIQASGMREQEATDLFERELKAHRSEKRSSAAQS